MKRMSIVIAALAAIPTIAHAEDPIIGNWKTELGDTTAITSCGGGYCITLKSGKHAGKQIGTFKGRDGSYEGRITDPDANKTYDGSVTVSGNALKLKGCVLKVVCESQTWPRL
ncbi:DUF2147 domain-containing protein [Rhizobium hidalgonense]|uniref:DUF2147 domain-containing protein n=1 Tax=Rhizobium hidalgonense TaxID=1538159 RepID=A0A2A6K9M9_9HYPH|nr:DUF2147 domain-containing protein [Rhizobium hidalgonense]MDR9776991.1 DUF2147 domain-containing protein [Rhizobium hidalgonense]MDR9814744.1 DUF2147 domain-containing protein [Rhizobium hidalgonense]MDR9823725.1 DUF2147 domain-containing protein [Rhizobium hidalgonense]PDT21191.1 hypothetical protein CO674_23270 [Rhizobium hidalgonense]PON07841.1 hypothetical protein ATY29_08825 [Rhizobium hidalgonense]